VALHEVAFLFKLLQALVAGQEFTRIRNVLLHQLLHLGFDFLQIFGGEWSRTVEVVEKSALGSRTVPQLGFGKELQHGSGQQVRRGMPIYLERLGVLLGQDSEIGVFLQRTSQVDEIAIRFCHQCGLRQPRTDRFRDLERARALRYLLRAPVREFDLNSF